MKSANANLRRAIKRCGRELDCGLYAEPRATSVKTPAPAMKLPLTLAGVVLLLATGMLAADTSAEAPVPRFAQRTGLKLTTLPGVDEPVWAGKFTVFENRKTRTGRTIDLNVIVMPALDAAAAREPIFELAGGPGAAASGMAPVYATDQREYRRYHDVVLVDQRGTGESNPLTPVHDSSPAAYLGEMYPEDYVRTLRRQLEQRADLAHYTTPIAMDDLDDVRAWLGYDRIILSGLSYGTRAAMVYLRQYPEHVRSLLLTSVSPTFHHLPLNHGRDAQRALELLFDDCARDPVAHAAFPHLRQELADLLARLDHEPARVRYVSADGKTDVPVEINRDIFMEKIRTQLYAPFSARKVPLIIHEAARGNYAPFLAIAIPADRSVPSFIADGAYLCVTATEDTPFIDPAAAAALNRENQFGNYRVVQQLRAGRLWPRGELPANYGEPVHSEVPVLIFTGYLDPVTPPVWAETVARHLPNSRVIVLRHGGHVFDGLAHYEQLDEQIIKFLDTADPKQVDATVLEQMLPPPFATEWKPPAP